jgi:hypothetical protein
MNWTLWKFDLIRLVGLWLPATVIVLLFVLAANAPLDTTTMPIIGSAALLGIVSGWLLFADPPSIQVYLFTRGLSRQRIFWNRWCLGMAGIVLVTALAAVLIGGGTRAEWHRRWEFADAMFFPLIQRFEWRCLLTLFSSATLAFCLSAFATVRGCLTQDRRGLIIGFTVRRAVDAVGLVLAAWVMLAAIDSEFTLGQDSGVASYDLFWQTSSLPLLYLVVAPALATWGAAYGYRRMELPA